MADHQVIALDRRSAPTRAGAPLVDLEPELTDRLPREAIAEARTRLVVPVEDLPAGPWDPEAIGPARRSAFGILVIDGLLSRDVTVAGGGALELLGAGDLVHPWVEGAASMLAVGAAWSVVEPARIAILEPRTVDAMAAWPPILEAVTLRAGRRAARLAVHQAISQLPRVEQRVLALLWYLAERWGRVTTAGVAVTLPLSHAALGRLVGARRPTVSLALKELAAQNLVRRREDGSWILPGDPPEGLASVLPARRRERVVELRPLAPPPRLAALSEQIVALRGRYERNLDAAADAMARSEATRATSRRLVTRPPRRARLAAPPRRPARRG
jgi:CRP/FNR family transcriptional regulator, cyclic AMP receptor protein